VPVPVPVPVSVLVPGPFGPAAGIGTLGVAVILPRRHA
jgi:hypothetical protein